MLLLCFVTYVTPEVLFINFENRTNLKELQKCNNKASTIKIQYKYFHQLQFIILEN